jgi:uncharacterized membrane protein HdeD (DUF308 family)
MFNPFGSKDYEFLYPSARRKDDPGWGWAILLGVVALATAAGALFGLTCAGAVLVLAVLLLVGWQLRRGPASRT